MLDKILIINNYNKGDVVRRILSKGIRWDEEVEILNGDSSIRKITVLGSEIIEIFNNTNFSLEDLNDFKWIEDGNNIISVDKRYELMISEILIPKVNLDEIKEKLQKNFIIEINDKEWDKNRIEIGMIGHEEINNQIPFNVGLEGLVKMDKGCYPGQEIHARLESRVKQKKALVTLICENYINKGEFKINEGGKIIITTANNGVENDSTFFGIIPVKYIKNSKIVLLNGNELTINKIINFRHLNVHH
jgi:folate-binding protein YgfZ